MSTEAKEIFLRIVELEARERAEELAALRRDAPDLAVRVESLLRAHERAADTPLQGLPPLDRVPGLVRELLDREAPPPAPGATLGDYELVEEVASGASGVVWRARQRSLERVVALKLLRAGRLAGAREVERFRAEAGAVAALDHPHIVPVYAVGEHEGRPFFSMKWLEGGSLDAQVGTAWEPRRAARLVLTVARAVHHAHQRGLLHRDLKPSNVLLDERGEPHVADFGIAKRLDAAEPGSRTALAGTPAYMAPEQAGGGELTVATDVWALGCVLFELVSGSPAFEGRSMTEILQRIREGAAPSLRARRSDAPRELATIVATCLAREPERRYPSANALADDLARWLAHEPIVARRPSFARRMVLAWRRAPLVASLAALSALLVVALAVGGTQAAFVLRARLRDAWLGEARATRLAELPGRRTTSLALLARAARVRPGPDLRDEAIAALALSDLVVEREWPRPADGILGLALDPARGRFARGVGREVRVHAPDGTELARRVLASVPNGLRFSGDGRLLGAKVHPQVDATATGYAVLELVERPGVGARAEAPGAVAPAEEPGAPARTEEDPGADAIVEEEPAELAPGAEHAPVSPGAEHAPVSPGAEHAPVSPGAEHASVAPGAEHAELGPGAEPVGLVLVERFVIEGAVGFDAHDVWAGGGDELVAVGLLGGEVLVHEVATGARRLALELGARAGSLRFAPDGTRLAIGVGGGRNELEVRAVADGRRLASVALPAAPFMVEWTEDGETVFVGCGDYRAYAWDPPSATLRLAFEGHRAEVTTVRASPAAPVLVTYGWDETTRVWDAHTGAELLHVSAYPLGFSADGRELGFYTNEHVGAWRLERGAALRTLHGHGGKEPRGVAFAPDGRTLVSRGTDGAIAWDVASGRRVARLTAEPVEAACFAPDGALLLLGPRGLERRAAEALSEPGERLRSAPCEAAGITADGRLVAALGGGEARDRVLVMDLAGGADRELVGPPMLNGVAPSPDGRWIAAGSWKGRGAHVWSAATGELACVLHPDETTITIAFAPDGRTLATGSSARYTLWRAGSWSELARVERGVALASGGGALAFAPDGARLAVALDADRVALVDAASGTSLGVLEAPGQRGVTALAFAPDGRRLAVACDTNRVALWDLAELAAELAELGLELGAR